MPYHDTIPCVCQQCEREFLGNSSRVKAGLARFCSIACHNVWQGRHRTEQTCTQCGRIFRKKGNPRFCSQTCYHAHRKRPEIARVCGECGKSFTVKAWMAQCNSSRFCTRNCYHKSLRRRRGETHHRYRPRVEHICEWCGKVEKTSAYYVQRGRRFCSHRCHSLWQRTITGEQHPSYKGVVRSERIVEMNRARYNEWRTAVFQRDHFTCQMCGVCGGRLNAHHLKRWRDYADQRYNVDNGVTLCVPCHRSINHNGPAVRWQQKHLV